VYTDCKYSYSFKKKKKKRGTRFMITGLKIINLATIYLILKLMNNI